MTFSLILDALEIIQTAVSVLSNKSTTNILLISQYFLKHFLCVPKVAILVTSKQRQQMCTAVSVGKKST